MYIEFIRQSMMPPPELRRCVVCDAKFAGAILKYGKKVIAFGCGGYIDDDVSVSVCPKVGSCHLCEQEDRHAEKWREEKPDRLEPFYRQVNWAYSANCLQVCDEHYTHRAYSHQMDRTTGQHHRATTEMGYTLGIVRGWKREQWQLRPDSRHQLKTLPLNPFVVYEHDLKAVTRGEINYLLSRSLVRPKPLFRFHACDMSDLARIAAEGDECARIALRWLSLATQKIANQYLPTEIETSSAEDTVEGHDSLEEAHTEVWKRYPACHRVPVRDGWQWVFGGNIVAGCIPKGDKYPIEWGKAPKTPGWWQTGGWSGEVVYIVGGGESLKDFDWDQLKGKRVIAINRAFEKVPDADVVMFTDVEFAGMYGSEMDQHTGWKVWANPAKTWENQSKDVVPKMRKMIAVRCPEVEYWGDTLDELGYGKNTGYAAINLADVLGAGEIRLLGFDMKGKWWHDGYGDLSLDESVHEEHRKAFEWAAEHVKGLSRRVVNLSKDSALTCFRKPSSRTRIVVKEQILEDDLFRGRRVFVVGGGPSLRNFDWDLLDGESVIAVNRAYERVPDADVLFSVDDRFYGWHCHKLHSFSGVKVWGDIRGRLTPGGTVRVGCGGGEHAFGNTLEDLGHGGNSGYAAVNLAHVLGASSIYLLGFDMRGSGGKQQWWHSGYPKVSSDTVYERYLAAFDWLADEAKRRSDIPPIINLSDRSAITGFPFRMFPPKVLPTFTSGFTPNYMDLATELIMDLDELGLRHHIVPWPETGSWVQNCAQKPRHMQMMRDMLEGPIVWVDADARVRSVPTWFYGCDGDVAVHRKPEVLSGTIWFGDTDRAREVLARWVELQESHPDVWDQKMLARALSGVEHVEAQIPVSHVKIYDSGDGVEPVIEHFQASRERKHSIAEKASR